MWEALVAMTGLLVSVRSAAEAEIALAGGADVVDVKEPRRGALGAADPAVWREVLGVVGGRSVTSAALGELHGDTIRDHVARVNGFTYAKIGLSGWRRHRNSPTRWFEARLALPQQVCPVPVVYADVESMGWKYFYSGTLSVIAMAKASQSPLMVIDTFQKDGRNLLDHVPVATLRDVSNVAAEHEIQLVLAGSLDESAMEVLLPLSPAYVGVRGAACVGGRDGAIDLARVKSLAEIVRGGARKVAS